MDKEKAWALIIEQANIQMKLALKAGVVDTLHKEIIKSNVRKLIDDTKNALKEAEAPKELIAKVESTLKLRFADWYTIITDQILKEAVRTKNPLLFKSYQEITGEELKKSKGITIEVDGYSEGSIPNIEDYMTTGRTAGAQSFMDGYVDTVKKTMKTIADKNLVMRDRLGRKMSLRNLAEMTARFQNTQERLQKLKDSGIEYVVASSHSNASERCQIWQGKIFILDCDVGASYKQTVDLNYRPTPVGKIDGLDYYSLMDAMLHGFLGYNCRHRLVKYQKGMDLFNEYDANTIAKERGLEEKQRYLERKIRKAKEKASLAITPDERKKYIAESKHYQDVYAKFCHTKGLVRYDWRTRITNVERNIKVDYGLMEKDSNGIYKSNFTTIEDALYYARKEQIRLKRSSDIEELNENIAIIQNLRNELRPIEPERNLKNYLGKDNIKIVPISSTEKREGTAVHIINDGHKEMYLDKNRLISITTDLDKQEVLALGVVKKDNKNDRFVYAIRLDELHSTLMVIDDAENSLELVTAYSPSNKKAKKILEKCCIIFNNLV